MDQAQWTRDSRQSGWQSRTIISTLEGWGKSGQHKQGLGRDQSTLGGGGGGGGGGEGGNSDTIEVYVWFSRHSTNSDGIFEMK